MKCAIRTQAGFSIVELLVAMAISLMLLTAVYQVFLGNTQTYRINENQARLQENGRFALDILIREVRSAGYYGCSGDAADPSFLGNFAQAVEGFESTSATVWTPTVDASITSPLGGSDILTIRRTDPTVFMRVATDMTAPDADIAVTDVPDDLEVGDFLLINDCQEAWVFQSSSAGSPIAHGTSFTYAFAAGSEVYKIDTVTYYISNDDDNQPALFRKIGAAAAEPILQGVENMQVLYGEDTDADGDVNVYRTANNVNVNDWNNVLSVRVGLLLRTPEEIAGGDLDTNVYTVNGTNVDPVDDRRQRRVFTTTIGLRNKLL